MSDPETLFDGDSNAADPMITSLVKQANELQDARNKIAELEKKVKQEAEYAKSAREDRTLAMDELEQVHLLLDVLPGAPGRTSANGEPEWNRPKNKAMTRLAGYLAVRS